MGISFFKNSPMYGGKSLYSSRAFNDRISDMASHYYFGFDINPDLLKATKMNMVMNNDGSGNILQANSLLPPHEWTDEFRTKLADAIGVNKSEIRNHNTIAFAISLILTCSF